MQANWSLVLNIVLLVGVVFAITRLMFLRKKEKKIAAKIDLANYNPADEIISVRKIDTTTHLADVQFKLNSSAQHLEKESIGNKEKFENTILSKPSALSETQGETERKNPYFTSAHADSSIVSAKEYVDAEGFQDKSDDKFNFKVDTSKMIMMFLSAKENQEFVGYELLQALLAAGLRFGEGDIFHKYQKANGQGAVLFSLAAATKNGTFDLHNMGSCKVKGLCLYMYLSGNNNIDLERFSLMYDAAKSLAEDLHANLLDDKQKLFSTASMERYRNYLCVAEMETI